MIFFGQLFVSFLCLSLEIPAATVNFLNAQANSLVELDLHVGNLIMEVKYDLDDIQKGYSAYDSSSHSK